LCLWGRNGLNQRYTQREVGRILGVQPGRLLYWERLRFIRPRARWGERFYSFSDLVALRSLQQITQRRVPARRVRKALSLMEEQLGAGPIPLHELRLVEIGGEIAIVPPGAGQPFDPFRRQWLLPLESAQSAPKLHPMAAQSAHDLFEAALRCEETPDLLPSAVDCYRKVIDLAPNWIEAHINLGVAYYQMGQLGEAREAFFSAVQLDPGSGISRYNLGCVLEEQGDIDMAIDHLRRAAAIMPAHADVHFNLALAYEKKNDRRAALEQWQLYLRYAPNGPWADQARSRLRNYSTRRSLPAPIPFPRKSQAE
jgi:tetratricopeptide (TPR) repeat protein